NGFAANAGAATAASDAAATTASIFFKLILKTPPRTIFLRASRIRLRERGEVSSGVSSLPRRFFFGPFRAVFFERSCFRRRILFVRTFILAKFFCFARAFQHLTFLGFNR
ncbi:hypothetical protein, partial [Pyramidobacter piscolens]|uniref:hypothetical protein n=1 Tax=Pyramidobacter piscolens TaxID=638849 RepID=UPI002666BDC8